LPGIGIGVDLDGTIVVYDELFHREALARLGMPTDVPVRKNAVRDWLRAAAGGEHRWVELQGAVYGPLMAEAAPAPGVKEFLAACRASGLRVSVVSHRTARSVADPRVDLYAAARDWLERQGFFAEPIGLASEDVYFEQTRGEKIARISSLGCALFVDDLEEVFAETAFPVRTERWLYAPAARGPGSEVHVFSDWGTVLRRALELKEAAGAR
jgi:hypothetical protein